MRIATFHVALLLLPLRAASTSVVSETVSVESSIAQIRDAFLEKESKLSSRLQSNDGERKLRSTVNVAPNNSKLASIEETLIHLNRALEQQDDKKARAMSLEKAMAKLQSMVTEDDGLDTATAEQTKQQLDASNVEITVNTLDTSTVSEADAKELFTLNVDQVTQVFKDAVAAVHYAFEADEEKDYLGRRLEAFYDCDMEEKEMTETELYATTKVALVDFLNEFMEGRVIRVSPEVILDVASTIMAFPASFVYELGRFLAAWTLHHTTCLKDAESIAQMQTALFIDYMVRTSDFVEERAAAKAAKAEEAASTKEERVSRAEKKDAAKEKEEATAAANDKMTAP